MSEEGSTGLDLPDSIAAWLDERAAESYQTREELLRQLLDAHRTLEGDATSDQPLEALVREQVDETLGSMESSLVDDIDAIRERVDELERQVTDAEADDTIAERLDEVEEALTNLAGGMLDIQQRLDGLTGTPATDPPSAADAATEPAGGAGTGGDRLLHIKRRAAQEGIETAACGACNEDVSILLLPEAACPHCGTSIGGLHSGGRLFDKPRLAGKPVAEGKDSR